MHSSGSVNAFAGYQTVPYQTTTHSLHYGGQQRRHPPPCLGAGGQGGVRRQVEGGVQLGRHRLGVGGREVHLVDDGDQVQALGETRAQTRQQLTFSGHTVEVQVLRAHNLFERVANTIKSSYSV